VKTGKSIPPEEIIAFCSERIAKFKVPRYIEYRESFPRTPTERVEKHKLVAEKKDLEEVSDERRILIHSLHG
jgi:crotonobetaine/carnitine-CoA ligase